eukprot:9921605-Ditylum_brightwellii.AAC.1
MDVDLSGMHVKAYAWLGRIANAICTALWRGEKVLADRVMIPCVSPENETTNKGVAKVFVKILILANILQATNADGMIGNNLTKLDLNPGYEDCYLVLIGDDLSQIHLRTFIELTQSCSYKLLETLLAIHNIQMAMKQ